MRIEQIFTSPGHNYYGHHDQPPDDFPLVAGDAASSASPAAASAAIASSIIETITKGRSLFSLQEVFAEMARTFGLTNKSPGVLRRNVIVSGVELNDLIGSDFELQGVQFHGTAHCAPCYWMDTAFAPGAEKFLAGRGGLRARILTDGRISVGDAQLKILQSAPTEIP